MMRIAPPTPPAASTAPTTPLAAPAKREMRILPSVSELRVEQAADGHVHLTGCTIPYGVLSDSLGHPSRPWKERIMPGAFTEVLRKTADIKHLQNHDQNIVLGSTGAGTTRITEDSKGVHFDTLLADDNVLAQALGSSVRRGDVKNQSFGFVIAPGGDKWVNEGGIDVREVHRVAAITDISTVANPAYPSTTCRVEMRSLFPDGLPASFADRGFRLDEEAGVCECDCTQCTAGDCAECSDDTCDDGRCVNCPNQEHTEDGKGSEPAGKASEQAGQAAPASGEAGHAAHSAPSKKENSKGTSKWAKNAAKNAAKTKRVDGEDLTAGDFIIATDPSDPKTWKLPWRFSTLEKTKSHLRNALSRFNQLKGVSESEKSKAWTKLVRLCKKYGIKVTENEIKSEALLAAYAQYLADGGECECDCSSCMDGDCDECTNEDCDDEDCKENGCPNQKAEDHFAPLIAECEEVRALRAPLVPLAPPPAAEGAETRTTRPRSELRSKLHTDGTLELHVYGLVGADWWGGGTSLQGVKQAVNDAGQHTRIRVCINSMGGDAFEGVGIYNFLRQQGKPVETRVDGMAASAASLIAMAGDRIVMGSNCMMMVHNAQAGVRGYAADMRKFADILDKISFSIANTYVDRTGMAMDAIQKMMNEETWMSAFEAVRAGFATEIGEEPDRSDEEVRSSPLTATYRNVPSRYREALPAAAPAALVPVPDLHVEDDEFAIRLRLAAASLDLDLEVGGNEDR